MSAINMRLGFASYFGLQVVSVGETFGRPQWSFQCGLRSWIFGFFWRALCQGLLRGSHFFPKIQRGLGGGDFLWPCRKHQTLSKISPNRWTRQRWRIDFFICLFSLESHPLLPFLFTLSHIWWCFFFLPLIKLICFFVIHTPTHTISPVLLTSIFLLGSHTSFALNLLQSLNQTSLALHLCTLGGMGQRHRISQHATIWRALMKSRHIRLLKQSLAGAQGSGGEMEWRNGARAIQEEMLCWFVSFTSKQMRYNPVGCGILSNWRKPLHCYKWQPVRKWSRSMEGDRGSWSLGKCVPLACLVSSQTWGWCVCVCVGGGAFTVITLDLWIQGFHSYSSSPLFIRVHVLSQGKCISCFWDPLRLSVVTDWENDDNSGAMRSTS